jgi:hemolysin D
MSQPHPVVHASTAPAETPLRARADGAWFGFSSRSVVLRPRDDVASALEVIEMEAPVRTPRLVLWMVCVLVLLLAGWAGLGQLDVVVVADGKLLPRNLVKIVQPAEAGVLAEVLVGEGERVRAGQLLARLDDTVARADAAGLSEEQAQLRLQLRRVEAELTGASFLRLAGDDVLPYTRVRDQYQAELKALAGAREQERAQLERNEHERAVATRQLARFEQSLPAYQQSAEAYERLRREGFVGALAALDKQREAQEKRAELEAQRSAVAALNAAIAVQQLRLRQIDSEHNNRLQKERAELQVRLAQLQPGLKKSRYRQALLELKSPASGVVKDLATTTAGAVLAPGTLLMNIVPDGELLVAEAAVRNEDVGFLSVDQPARIKLAAYPFQRYGMLEGRVEGVAADASTLRPADPISTAAEGGDAPYRVRIALNAQQLAATDGTRLRLTPGMRVVVEIRQGRRSVLEYLMAPLQKVWSEAARER